MTIKARDRKWWKQAAIYQIYPASFCDSNGDGVGDLQGIISKLDYISQLGADAIWICPMFQSPQVDMGYDISDFEAVFPPYGTLQDMETLIQQAHAKGLRVMLDLVINHTSDLHAWFQESRSSINSPKRDWYIWRPAKYTADGQRVPPNNWRCNFGGGSAWEWDEQTGEYYLHLFAKEQPDLNWENPVTRRAIYASAMEFWLEKGVDGFRVDTVNMYSKLPDFPDAPITDPKAPFQPAGMLYCNGPRMHEFLDEMNEILSRYGAITVGELPNTPDMKQVLRYVSAEAKQLDMVFQFDLVDVGFGVTHKFETTPKNYTLPQVKAAIDRTQGLIRGTDAWTTVFMENHDQARSVSRFTDDSPEYRVRGAKMLALMQACLSGTQYIYQGQEIGCVNAPLETYPVENYLDIDSCLFIKMIKEYYGTDNTEEIDRGSKAMQHLARDHARLPMPWNAERKWGGFSEAAEEAGQPIKEPWMKHHPLAGEINVASQLKDPNSVLAFWRKMLRFRRDHADVLVYGDYQGLRAEDADVHMFLKDSHGGGGGVVKALVVLNFTKEEQRRDLPGNKELGFSQDHEVRLVPVMSTHAGKAATPGVLGAFEGQVYFVSS